jgi:hypothetical protein
MESSEEKSCAISLTRSGHVLVLIALVFGGFFNAVLLVEIALRICWIFQSEPLYFGCDSRGCEPARSGRALGEERCCSVSSAGRLTATLPRHSSDRHSDMDHARGCPCLSFNSGNPSTITVDTVGRGYTFTLGCQLSEWAAEQSQTTARLAQ